MPEEKEWVSSKSGFAQVTRAPVWKALNSAMYKGFLAKRRTPVNLFFCNPSAFVGA